MPRRPRHPYTEVRGLWRWEPEPGDGGCVPKRRFKRLLRLCLARAATDEQKVALGRYRMAEARYLMGQGPRGKGRPPMPDEIIAPDGDVYPWARPTGPRPDEHMRIAGLIRRMR